MDIRIRNPIKKDYEKILILPVEFDGEVNSPKVEI